MVYEDTVIITENREISFKVPESVPCGAVDVVVVFHPRNKDSTEKPLYTPKPFPSIAELKADAERKYKERFKDGKDALQELCGSMADVYTEDGVTIQRRLRDEWSA